MPFSEQAREHAFDTLEKRRQSAIVRANDYKNKAVENHPKLTEFDQQIASLGISLTKATIIGGVDIQAIQSSIDELNKKRIRYMKRNGIDADTSFFFCKKCEDTGYYNGSLCECAKQLMTMYTSEMIGKVSPLTLSSFSSFTLDRYSTQADGKHKSTPKKNMEKVYKSCVKFARNFPNYENLLFMGDSGLGKTHLALAVANEVISKGYNVVYCNSSNIFKAIETEYFQDQRATETLETMKICDLLILDDLGSEFINSFLASTLYDIVNTRLVTKLPSIYTTNIVSANILETRYGDKVCSRLLGCCSLLSFYGEDLRI